MSSPPVLESQAVRREFPGTVALDGVDFAIERGRVHALIGENGAGKSTLVNILGGVDRPSSGTLRMDGAPVVFHSVRDAAARGVAIIHQELQLFPNLSCAENLFIGRERRDRLGLVDHRAQRDKATEVFARLGQAIDPSTLVGSLPLGLQQLVEIARALVYDARVLMMDEPTSALTASETHRLFTVIRDLASHGVAVVYISHRLEELLDIADVVTVLRDGRLAGHAPAPTIDVPWIVSRITGRDVSLTPRSAEAATAAPLLRIEHLTLPPRAGRTSLDDVSLDVRPGEVVGIYGLMGAGRTELFESVLGVHADAEGHVSIGDRVLDRLDIPERVEAGVFMVPEDRKAAGLVQTMTVGENMTLSSLNQLSQYGYLPSGAEATTSETFRTQLRIKCASLDSPITSLSGGNQQKVVVARGLMNRPRVMLLDEPTRGVDVGAKAELVGVMRQLAADGMAVVFATSDLGEVLQGATRIVVMAGGRVTAEMDAGSATETAIASAASAGTRTNRAPA